VNSDPTGLMFCDGSTCASLQYFEAHPTAGDSGGGGSSSGGSSSGGSSSGGGGYTPYYGTYAPPSYISPYYGGGYARPHPYVAAPRVAPRPPSIVNSLARLTSPACGLFQYRECFTASLGVSVVGGAQGSIAAVGSVTTRASATMRAGGSEGGQIMRVLRGNQTWQDIGRLGRSDTVDLAGKYVLGVGAALTAVGVYQQTGNAGEAAVDAAGDTAISWGAAEGGAWAGGEIGFAVGGPVGALVGAGVSLVASGAFNNVVGDVASWF
jgi:hypothetical protein